MIVILLEIDHEIQRADAWRPNAMKAEYRGLLERLIAENGVQFVGEEANPAHETTAKQVSDALRLPLPWANIDMPEQVREQRGIAREQRARVPILQPGAVRTHMAKDGYHRDLGNGWSEFIPRVPSDDIREDYMYEQTIQQASDAGTIMVLCGIMHIDGLERRFRETGHVTTMDSVQNYSWYSNC